ncbi:hypothetical protein BH09DEP1_BH09DEP1_0410 [soil metagenome]
MNKAILIVLVIIVAGFLYIMSKDASIKKTISIRSDADINTLPLAQLKNLRYLSAQEKERLFEKLELIKRFSPEKACNTIQTVNEPYVILWFADHTGNLSAQGAQWYQENVFSACTNSQFALVDLAAWKYFSLPLSGFEKENSADILQSLLSKCDLCNTLSSFNNYRMLYSSDFFGWLNRLNAKIDAVIPHSSELLVRSDFRKDAMRFSLREIGYTPSFLNVWCAKLQCNLLDADQTQIFQLLQYLEGIYYALCVIDNALQENKQECTVIFLLANKEFTYYVIENESSYFQTFANDLNAIAQQEQRPLIPANIYFLPFGFGTSFYDQPFEYGTATIKTQKQLLEILDIKD